MTTRPTSDIGVALAKLIAENLNDGGRSHALGGWVTATAIGESLWVSIADDPDADGNAAPATRFELKLIPRSAS